MKVPAIKPTSTERPYLTSVQVSMHVNKAAAKYNPDPKEDLTPAAIVLDMDALQESLSSNMNGLSIHINASGMDKYPGDDPR